MEDGSADQNLSCFSSCPQASHHLFMSGSVKASQKPLINMFNSLQVGSSHAINSVESSMNIYGLFQKFTKVFLQRCVDRHTHLGDKCATQWQKAPGRTWPKAIEAAVLLLRFTLLENVHNLRRTFLESQLFLLLGHGGTRPGEHQPAGPLRISCGPPTPRLIRCRVHYAEVCARSRTAQLPLGFPEGWRSNHRHHRGAGEASPAWLMSETCLLYYLRDIISWSVAHRWCAEALI